MGINLCNTFGTWRDIFVINNKDNINYYYYYISFLYKYYIEIDILETHFFILF